MAVDIFILMDCIGLFFLIYVLANFWNEWRRYGKTGHQPLRQDEKYVGDRIALIPPVYLYPKDPSSVIPFPARYRQIHPSPEHHSGFAKTIEMRKRVAPTAKASHGRM